MRLRLPRGTECARTRSRSSAGDPDSRRCRQLREEAAGRSAASGDCRHGRPVFGDLPRPARGRGTDIPESGRSRSDSSTPSASRTSGSSTACRCGSARRMSASSRGSAALPNVYPARYFTLGPRQPAADPDLATAIQMTGADIAQASSGTDGCGRARSRSWTPASTSTTQISAATASRRRGERRLVPELSSHRAVRLRRRRLQRRSDERRLPAGSASRSVPDDCNGHGTHVAGIVGADGDSPASQGRRSWRHVRCVPRLRL